MNLTSFLFSKYSMKNQKEGPFISEKMGRGQMASFFLYLLYILIFLLCALNKKKKWASGQKALFCLILLGKLPKNPCPLFQKNWPRAHFFWPFCILVKAENHQVFKKSGHWPLSGHKSGHRKSRPYDPFSDPGSSRFTS